MQANNGVHLSCEAPGTEPACTVPSRFQPLCQTIKVRAQISYTVAVRITKQDSLSRPQHKGHFHQLQNNLQHPIKKGWVTVLKQITKEIFQVQPRMRYIQCSNCAVVLCNKRVLTALGNDARIVQTPKVRQKRVPVVDCIGCTFPYVVHLLLSDCSQVTFLDAEQQLRVGSQFNRLYSV